MVQRRSVQILRSFICMFLLAKAVPVFAEPVAFRRIVELALKHSNTVAIANADNAKAEQVVAEARRMYIPQVTLGSGLGYSYGIPASIEGNAPAIFNVTTQQFLLNFAQHDAIRAAEREVKAARQDVVDKSNVVALDAASAYIELDNWLKRITSLSQQQKDAERGKVISQQRLQAGIDSPLDVKRAELAAARVELRMAEAQGSIDILREHLSRLTGLSAASIETTTDSIPALPDFNQQQDLMSAAIETSPIVKFADERVKASEFRARAEHRMMLPAIDFASQYQMLSTYNNYDQYYKKFTRNSATIGLAVRIPILNSAQKAKANQAEADLVKAHKAADIARAQVSEETLKIQRSLRQLKAASEVSRLEYEIAQSSIGATQLKMQNGQATIHDQQQAEQEAGDRYLGYMSSSLELQKAALQLLRSTGQIQNWALSK